MSGIPKNWPSSVQYLKENVLDKSVIPPSLKLKPKDAKVLTCPRVQGVCKVVAIKKIDTTGHPARGQNGLFALKDLPPRTYILDYKGLITARASETSDYVLTFEGDLSIDAEFQGNEARHINDFRGVSKRPNAEFDNYLDRDGVLHMGVFVLHERIPKAQEILVSYGKGFWQARGLLPERDAYYSSSHYTDWDTEHYGASEDTADAAEAPTATAAIPGGGGDDTDPLPAGFGSMRVSVGPETPAEPPHPP
jgi:hypothetical protein